MPATLSLIAACSSEADVAPPASVPESAKPPVEDSPDASDTGEPPPAPIDWQRCSLETGGDDKRAECANVEVPLDWSAPDGKKITFFVKRLLGKGTTPRQQIWLLQGGPGGAGDGLEPLAESIASRDSNVDIYIPDHRGTGRSARLDCTSATKDRGDFMTCVKEAEEPWGKGALAMFTTSAAARDVGHVIERAREKGQAVHVYGISYGTYWAQRYLQLFPSQPTAVTLDGLCQSGLCSYAKQGYWRDLVGKKYLGECAADPTCKSKLGPDPVATVHEAIARADAGTCQGIAGVNGGILRQIYGILITSFQMRVLVPSSAFRIVRCNSDDVAALKNFMNALGKLLGGSNFGPEELSSEVLSFNIALSEMEEVPAPTGPQVEALLKDALFAAYSPEIIALEEVWPKYARDAYVGKYPDSSVPVLLMNGTLDAQTPQSFADEISKHYVKPHQTYVIFPRATHGVLQDSPTIDSSDETCGTTVWKQFVANPTATLDTSCRERILGHGFDGSEAIAQYFFGQPSLWGTAAAMPTPKQRNLALSEKSVERAFTVDLARARREMPLTTIGAGERLVNAIRTAAARHR